MVRVDPDLVAGARTLLGGPNIFVRPAACFRNIGCPVILAEEES